MLANLSLLILVHWYCYF